MTRPRMECSRCDSHIARLGAKATAAFAAFIAPATRSMSGPSYTACACDHRENRMALVCQERPRRSGRTSDDRHRAVQALPRFETKPAGERPFGAIKRNQRRDRRGLFFADTASGRLLPHRRCRQPFHQNRVRRPHGRNGPAD